VSVSQGGGVSATEITLDGDFYPHGIATAGDGTLYIGSVALNTVVRVPANSTTPEPFVPAGVALAGVIGMKVDDDRGLLWLCDSDPRDMTRPGAVVGVSLDDGSEVVRHVLAAPDADSLFCNDLAIAYDGSVWATESIAGIIYRIDAADVMTPDSAEIWMRGGLAAPPAGAFGPSGLLLAGNTLFVANAGSGSLFVVDTTSDDPVADARALTLREGDKTGVSLCGPDGLLEQLGRTDGADLVVVENGGCTAATPRVVRIFLDD
jgi:DNA-binding beta-propeller fold protein YncE